MEIKDFQDARKETFLIGASIQISSFLDTPVNKQNIYIQRYKKAY